jgi:transposase
VLTLPRSVRIFLATAPVDMRAGHDGLFAIVRNQWQLDPFAGYLFAFVGKRGDRLKCLFWDRGGFVLYYKRLERGKFRLPRVDQHAVSIELDAVELSMLLDGIDVGTVCRPRLWEPEHRSGGRAA